MHRNLAVLLIYLLIGGPALAGEHRTGSVSDAISATKLDGGTGEDNLAYDATVNRFFKDDDQDGVHDTGEQYNPAGIFYADDYTAGTTMGIDAAVDAACAASGGTVVMPQGDVATTTTINIDCNYVELVGHYYGTELLPATGTSAITVTGDWVAMRDFRCTFSGANAANICIDMDNNASTVSRWSIQNVRLLGSGDTGKGIRCELCQKGVMQGGQVSDFEHGFYGLTTPNNNLFSSITFNQNDYGIFIADTMSSTISLNTVAFESNDIDGISCASNGAGIVVSQGSHFEGNTVSGMHRPASGCGFISIGDTFSSNGDDYLKESSGATDDMFIGTYWGTGSVGNTVSEVIPIILPSNASGLYPLNGTDAVVVTASRMITTTAINSSTAVANTTTETALNNCEDVGGNDFSVPANSLTVGTTIRFTAAGVISGAVVPGTIAFRVRWGTANTDPLIVDLGPSGGLLASMSSDGWRVVTEFTIRSIGASGTAVGNGTAFVPSIATGSETLWDAASGATTIDTTAATAPTLFVDWGTADAANTITAQTCFVEVL